MDLNIYDVDWKSLLIKKYKNYNLNEKECMIIFVSDMILKVEPHTLITKEVLSPYMHDQSNIDECLSHLIDSKIILIKNENSVFYSSLEEFKIKLFEDTTKDFLLRKNNPNTTSVSMNLYQEIESICNKTITPIERDQITSWLKNGADEGMIKEALSKSITKSGNISFKNADKLILNMQRSQARKDIGVSTVDEETKRKIKLENILATDWTKDEN